VKSSSYPTTPQLVDTKESISLVVGIVCCCFKIVGFIGSLVSPFLGRPLFVGLGFSFSDSSFSSFMGFSLRGIFVASVAL